MMRDEAPLGFRNRARQVAPEETSEWLLARRAPGVHGRSGANLRYTAHWVSP